jgi:hypothetical protein
VGKGRARKVYGLVVTLPHSAAHACVFSFAKRTLDFVEGLVGCLVRLGGVLEKLVLDNDSSIVEPRRPRQPARLHDGIAALLGHLRCLPVVLRPRQAGVQGPGRTLDRLIRVELPALADGRLARGPPGPVRRLATIGCPSSSLQTVTPSATVRTNWATCTTTQRPACPSRLCARLGAVPSPSP